MRYSIRLASVIFLIAVCWQSQAALSDLIKPATPFSSPSLAGKTITYQYYKPPGAATAPAHSIPIVLYLHGMHYNPDSINPSDTNPDWDPVLIFVTNSKSGAYPCFFVAPHAPDYDGVTEDKLWAGPPDYNSDTPGTTMRANPTSQLTMAKELVENFIANNPSIDPNRIYITGFSMGAFGTWDAITRWPDFFACAYPIAGGGDPSKASVLIRKPIWVHHAYDDPVIHVTRARGMVDAITAAATSAGVNPLQILYHEYPHASPPQVQHDYALVHQSYGVEVFLPWMFGQSLGTAPSITSAGTASATAGKAFNYTIIAANAPASFGATSLPVGLTVNTSSGVISGTPALEGTFNVTLSASNAFGSGTKTLVLTIVQGPFGGGSPAAVPGVVQAENYDAGGEGHAYHDLDSNNIGGQYRSEGVDIETCGEGGYDVAFTKAGEWMEYTVNVASAGSYNISVRAASLNDGGNFHIEFGGVDKTGSWHVPDSGGWQTWQTLTKNGINLSAGTQIMRLSMDSVGGIGYTANFNYISIAANAAPAVTLSASSPAPLTVQMSANATDSDGTISKVEYYDGSTLVGTNSAGPNPYAFTWNSASAGAHAVTARAYDNSNNVTTSNVVNVTVASNSLRVPENPAGAINGMAYEYFEGNWQILPNFDALSAVKTGSVTNFDLSPRNVSDYFGFRFTGYVDVPVDGTYTFSTSSDDGSKLYIGTTELVSNDGRHANQERSGSIGLMAGKHAITVNYFNSGGGFAFSVSYAGPTIAKTVIPDSVLYIQRGLTGTYFQNPDLTTQVLTRIDPKVDSTGWMNGTPDPAIDPFTFSIRWTGQIKAKTTEHYTFATRTDDGVRLYVNGQTLINKWFSMTADPPNMGAIDLVAGQRYDIVMEYYQNFGGATAQLLWESPTIVREVVPTAQLYPSAAVHGSSPSGASDHSNDWAGLQVSTVNGLLSVNNVDRNSIVISGKLSGAFSNPIGKVLLIVGNLEVDFDMGAHGTAKAGSSTLALKGSGDGLSLKANIKKVPVAINVDAVLPIGLLINGIYYNTSIVVHSAPHKTGETAFKK